MYVQHQKPFADPHREASEATLASITLRVQGDMVREGASRHVGPQPPPRPARTEATLTNACTHTVFAVCLA